MPNPSFHRTAEITSFAALTRATLAVAPLPLFVRIGKAYELSRNTAQATPGRGTQYVAHHQALPTPTRLKRGFGASTMAKSVLDLA